MKKAMAAEKRKQAYLEKQKVRLQEYQMKKSAEELEKKQKAEKEKKAMEAQKKKFAKEQENKKKQIAEYKRKKLEAEEMLANADLPEFDDYSNESFVQQQQSMGKSYGQSMGKQTHKNVVK